MWRKRVLITQLAAQAWKNVCSHFDFEAAATRLGMRMTADGSGDDLIQVEGVTQYGFTDEGGGAFGDGESEEDDEAEKPKHGPIMEQQQDTSGGITSYMYHITKVLLPTCKFNYKHTTYHQAQDHRLQSVPSNPPLRTCHREYVCH